MKRNRTLILPVLLVISAFFIAGCTSTTDVTVTTVDDTSHATPKGTGWSIYISGVRTDEVWESGFEKWKKAAESGYGEYEFERKGELVRVNAMPLVKVVAMVDDADATMPYSFNADLWESGYDLTFTAADGYSTTTNTAEHQKDELYIADYMNGEKINPMLCGNVSSKLWVKDLVEISAALDAVSLENNDFELLLEIGAKTGAYKIRDLEKLDYYIEDRGSFTNSYGNTFEHVWGGVKIVDLINQYTPLTGDMSVTIEAMDGYAMNYSGEQLLDNSDGDWILAFKEDGAYMPEDPGYVRLVKAGPLAPNFEGHVSARMVKKIIIKNTAFKNFELAIVSDSGTEIMDAQTLMSGVTNSKTVVEARDKKKDELKSYMGMPIYMLLERYSGYSTVKIEAADGFSITLAASELEGNDDVIIAMFKGDGTDLDDNEFPLVIAWDKDTEKVPAGIKAVRNVIKIVLE